MTPAEARELIVWAQSVLAWHDAEGNGRRDIKTFRLNQRVQKRLRDGDVDGAVELIREQVERSYPELEAA